MRWIDGNEINIKQFTSETLCEKLATELWDNTYGQWLKCADFIQVASFLIAFDTELTMEGIFTFLENSIGHYAPNIIRAFRTISDSGDADILKEICRLAPPDIMRSDFLSGSHQEYDITTFDENHEIEKEVEKRIQSQSSQSLLIGNQGGKAPKWLVTRGKPLWKPRTAKGGILPSPGAYRRLLSAARFTVCV